MFYHKNELRISSDLASTAAPASDSTNFSITSDSLFDNSEKSNNGINYSPNGHVNEVIKKLLSLGIAPLPVASRRDARLPGWHLTNRTKEGYSFCCLDKNGNPVSLFTGKNPSYLDRTGRPRLVKHKDYQTRLPSNTELKEWFVHPDTGVGAMCGHAGITWIDFDTKSYASQEECDQEVGSIIAVHGLGEGWIERTGSGGWRIPVKPRQQASFTNFSTVEGGVQRGEALGLGRFTVLAPTVHPNGISYKRISSGEIPSLESLEAIGIYPAKDAVKSQRTKERSQEWVSVKAVKKERDSNQPVTTLVDFLEYDLLPKLTVFQIFNWSGHDFQEYGSTLKGNPPWRQSSSGTSFHVWDDGTHWAWQDKATGEGGGAVQYRWRLRGGTGTPKGQDFYQIVEELARDAGLTVPPLPTAQSPTSPLPRHQEPEAAEYAEYLQGEVEQTRVEEAEAAISFGDLVKKTVNKIVDSAFKGFGKAPDQEPEQNLSQSVDVDIEFEEGDRLKVLRDLTKNGHKTILDISATGTGKSHTVGEATPSDLGVKTIFYTATNHRNPTTQAIRNNYVDLPVRNNGLVQDNETTVGGHPTIRWAVGDEEVNIPGNCPKTSLFHILAGKGYTEVTATASENPICNSCAQKFHCVGKFPNGELAERIEGFTFRQDRRSAFMADRVRASLTSLPTFERPSDDEVEGDGDKGQVLIIDEFDQQFDPTETIAVTSGDLDATFAAIAKAKVERVAIDVEIQRLRIDLNVLREQYATISITEPQADLVDKIRLSLNLKSVSANALPGQISSSKKKIRRLENDLAVEEAAEKKAKKLDELGQANERLTQLEKDLQSAEKQLKNERTFFDSRKTQREAYRKSLKEWQKQLTKLKESIDETEAEIHALEDERRRFKEVLTQIEESNKLAFLVQIKDLLDGKVKATSETRFGWSLRQLREIISLKTDPDLESFFKLLSIGIADILAGFGESDGIDLEEGLSAKDRKRMKRSIALANRKLRADQNRAFREYARGIMPNWVLPFYRVFTSQRPGSLRVRNGVLEIHQPHTRLRETILSADVRVILDATVTRERVARALAISPSEITVIRQKPKAVPNLNIVQVNGMGHLGGGDRSDSKKQRVAALQKALGEKHTSFKVIDHKRVKQDGQGHWFHDNRGSNEYQSVEAIALIGDPYNDLGHLLCQYESLTGKETPLEDTGFQSFVREHLQAEEIQGVGRLRAVIRPDEKLTVYAVTDQDMSYLKNRFPGAAFSQTEAFQITPDAGTRSQRTHWGVVEAAKQVVESGAKLTQQAIAVAGQMSQSLVSKIAGQCGGWRMLKKLLYHLLNNLGLCSTGNDLTDEERWLARDFLPLLQDDSYTTEQVITEVSQVAQSVGNKAFERILAYTPLHVKAYLTGRLFSILPIEFLDVFADTDMVLQALRKYCCFTPHRN